ncbi:MAG: hypothetical protein ACK4MM_00035 [Fervidobacterium sp.]
MNKINEIKLDGDREDFNREIYRLLLFCKQLTQLFETYFSGYLLIFTDEINRHYLRLCNKIQDILGKPGFEDLARREWQPFDNLRALDPDGPDIDYEYRGWQVCGNFLSTIEEVFISAGEKTYPLDMEDQRFLSSIQTYLEKYLNYKKEKERKWLQKIEKQAEEWHKGQEKPQVMIPQFDFKFIGNEKVKNLLINDWEDAQKAFQNGLNKSTVVLCVTILEALLIDALSCTEDEAKSTYCQKYLNDKGKQSKPPKIENWQLYKLIYVANSQGIISPDVARLSYRKGLS